MTGSDDLPYRPCVGVCLIDGRGHVFAGERLDTPGAWQMPQGGIDPGETPRQAGLRELEEEISVPASAVEVLAQTVDWLTYDLPPQLLGKVWGGRFRGQKQKWLLARLTGGDEAIRLETAHPEFGRWQWMRPDDLLGAIVPFKRDIYASVFAEFRPHLG